MRGPATGPARVVPSRTGSGRARCPAPSPAALVPGRARPAARIPARAAVHTPARAAVHTPARAAARTPARAGARDLAHTRCLAAHPGRRRTMAPVLDGNAIPRGQPARQLVSARPRTVFPIPATARAAVIPRPAATGATPASARPAVAVQLTVANGLTTPLGRRRAGAAGVAAMPGRDGSQPNLARTHHRGRLIRPAADGGV
jgi:hypothetical protein